jgi:hypothetical protein
LEGGSWSILQRQRSVHHTICRGKSAGDSEEFADLYITPAREAG